MCHSGTTCISHWLDSLGAPTYIPTSTLLLDLNI